MVKSENLCDTLYAKCNKYTIVVEGTYECIVGYWCAYICQIIRNCNDSAIGYINIIISVVMATIGDVIAEGEGEDKRSS